MGYVTIFKEMFQIMLWCSKWKRIREFSKKKKSLIHHHNQCSLVVFLSSQLFNCFCKLISSNWLTFSPTINLRDKQQKVVWDQKHLLKMEAAKQKSIITIWNDMWNAAFPNYSCTATPSTLETRRVFTNKAMKTYSALIPGILFFIWTWIQHKKDG